MPKFSFFTPSFNKKEYVGNAIKSVLSQTFTDFEYWIIENSTDSETRAHVKSLCTDPRIIYIEKDFTPEERKADYPTALILNEYYPKANGEYIVYLSDDDFFYPNLLDEVNKFFDARPDASAVYVSLKTMNEQPDGSFHQVNYIEANKARGKGTTETLNCQVDGGQVIHKKSCLDQVEQPFFAPKYPDAGICDGLFLDKLGKSYTIEPINIYLLEHRVTKKATWTSL